MYLNTPKLTSRPEPNVWGDRLPFGTICGDFGTPNGGWVHDVAFSPSGDSLAYVSEYYQTTG
jgi:actin related protein 2/3 complex subunit 1A/1B